MIRACLFFIGALTLVACAKPMVKETFPTHSTAVMESYVKNFGFKGQFASEGSRVVNTREQMQRVDDDFKFTGAAMKLISRPRSKATITRVDKNLLWQLNKKKKRYTECPLAGCAGPVGMPVVESEEGEQGKSGEMSESSDVACTTQLVKSDFSVDATGQKRVVNGFDAEEYKVNWLVVMEDDQKLKDTNTISMDIWTTAENAEIQEVLKTQASFHQAYLEKIGMEASLLGKVVPEEALKILKTFFLGAMGEKDREKALRVVEKLKKIKGYPISTRLEWYADTQACPRSEERVEEQDDEKMDLSGGIGGLMSGFTKKMAKKKMEEKAKVDEGKPIFGYVQEIKAMKMEEASDGLFQPPSHFKLADRK